MFDDYLEELVMETTKVNSPSYENIIVVNFLIVDLIADQQILKPT